MDRPFRRAVAGYHRISGSEVDRIIDGRRAVVIALDRTADDVRPACGEHIIGQEVARDVREEDAAVRSGGRDERLYDFAACRITDIDRYRPLFLVQARQVTASDRKIVV